MNPPAMQETQVCSLGLEETKPGLGRSPEEEIAAHSSILALRILWTEDPGGLQSIRLQTVSMTEAT